MTRSGPRWRALRALTELQKGRVTRLDPALDLQGLDQQQTNFCLELARGTERMRLHLDARLLEFANKGLPKDPLLLSCLRLGAYQLLFLGGVPDRAAVNETVTLAPKDKRGFVNAILRKLSGARSLPLPDDAKGLAAFHGLPQFLVERWVARLGLAAAQEVCAVCAAPPSLRLVDPKLGPGDRYTGGDPGAQLVQGAVAFAAAQAVDAKPGETILDLCAAPGGKAMVMAAAVGDDGRVLAFDTKRQRLKRVSENADRLGLSSRITVLADLENLPPLDAVLVDVPCSNTGVLNRRVEVRRRLLDESAILERTALQRELLLRAIDLVRPEGRVIYSTCSIEPEENEQLVESVLVKSPGVTLQRQETTLPTWDTNAPGRRGTDGGYLAVLRC